jgi:DNA-binding FadR family transcriptional regulator
MSELGGLIRSLGGRASARNFHSHVIGELGYRIVSGAYAVGSSLPGDAEMSAEFDVSRTVLREVLKSLESKGLVEARPKVGTKVSPRHRWSHFDTSVITWQFRAGVDAEKLSQLTDLRLAIEPLIADAIVAWRSADDIRMLHYWLKQMENSAASPLNCAIADFEIHVILADMSRNEFLRSFMGLTELAHCVLHERNVLNDKQVPSVLIESHCKLVAAVESGKGNDVRTCIKKSIELDFELTRK